MGKSECYWLISNVEDVVSYLSRGNYLSKKDIVPNRKRTNE